MSTYCDPLIDSWKWHDAETWHAPERKRIERTDFPPAGVVFRAEPAPNLHQEFARLASQWKRSTENLSSLTQILSDPSYKRIVALGRDGAPIVPMILRDLQEHDGFWASALHAITGENPVSPKHIGNAAKTRKDWLEWGKRQGHI
jgi:hypothetical protein